MQSFCPDCTARTGWTGRGLAWTARRCLPWAAGKNTGPNPTDRGKPGSKHHVLTEANGTPLSAILTGANRHDVTSAPGGLPLLDMEIGWTPCRRCEGDGAAPVAGPSPPAADTLTGLMTRDSIARNCGRAALRPPWPGGARNTAAGWGAPLGGRADPGMAAPVPPAEGALRAPR